MLRYCSNKYLLYFVGSFAKIYILICDFQNLAVFKKEIRQLRKIPQIAGQLPERNIFVIGGELLMKIQFKFPVHFIPYQIN